MGRPKLPVKGFGSPAATPTPSAATPGPGAVSGQPFNQQSALAAGGITAAPLKPTSIGTQTLPQLKAGEFTPTVSGVSSQNWFDKSTDAFNKLMEDDAAAWAGQQGTLQNQMDRFMVGADSMNARMGGSIAGGFAGLAGAALGQGMAQYNAAALDHSNRQRATQLAWLDKTIAEGQRQEERDWAVGDMAEDREMQLIQMVADGTLTEEQFMAIMDSGGDLESMMGAFEAAGDKTDEERTDEIAVGLEGGTLDRPLTAAEKKKLREAAKKALEENFS